MYSYESQPLNRHALCTIDQSSAWAGVSLNEVSSSIHRIGFTIPLSFQRRVVMNKARILSMVASVSLVLATGALAEVQGIQPGTSDNPKDNVPKEIQREGGDFGPGGSGPGSRSDELVGMKKEIAQSVTEKTLDQNVEKTQGGGAAAAAEKLGAPGGSAEDVKATAKKKIK
jgi:hypothetical protein